MISFENALDLVLKYPIRLGTENIALNECRQRVLGQDVVADMPLPPFDKSAMDGYACRRKDLAGSLEVLETIAAGTLPVSTIGPQQCSRIMTGAAVPSGADCVVMVENTSLNPDGTIRVLDQNTSNNIYYCGEDAQKGHRLLGKGTVINAEHIAVLAAMGCAEPLVSQRPCVGIISTGSELVGLNEKAAGACIRDSNSWQLLAQVQACGCQAINYGIAGDRQDEIDSLFKKAMQENNVVIMSGGVSVGDFDLVPDVLKSNGFEILFDRVAIKPGKPSTFAVCGDMRVFALPGNPVSTFIQFELLVRPFLYRMMGCDDEARNIIVPVGVDIAPNNSERTIIIPVCFNGGVAVPIRYNGSGHIDALTHADGYIIIPHCSKAIPEGHPIDVRLF